MLSLSKTRRTKEQFLTRARSSTAACCGPLRCATLWSAGTRLRPGLRSHRTASDQRRAIGSAGERLVHTEEVTGSIPVSPTRSEAMWVFIIDHDGSHSCSASRHAVTLSAMAGRRGWGEDSIYFDHSGECRDPEAHRHCPGRWRGVVSLKPGPDGQRRRKKVSGKNKTEVRAKLAELHDELDDGVVTNAAYTVAQAINDWLADGLAGRAPKTVSTQREVLEPLLDIIGA